MKYLSYLILVFSIGFNLYLYYPETKILSDPNDNAFQYSLVARTDWVWKNYGCPFSLSCLPNLVDHNVTAWAEGYPLPFYYSHIPQIVTVATYHLFVNPIMSLLTSHFSLYQYYNWTKYLLLALFPLPVFLALRVVGFTPLVSAYGAFFAAHFSTDGLYGIDSPSFLWRGYGLTSQLYAIFFAPLAVAFTYRALHKPTTHNPQPTTLFAILFLTLTIAGHLGIGVITLLSTVPLIFFDWHKPSVMKRIVQLFFIAVSSILILSYWILPAVFYNNYHIISFWDPIWKFDSYGWFEVVRQYIGGEVFDWGRVPLISALVIIGFFVASLSTTYLPFAIGFALMVIFYFGRTTWNGLIDLVPGMKDFHLHRFIVGVHILALFLIPAALETLLSILQRISTSLTRILFHLSRMSEPEDDKNAIKTPESWKPIIYLTCLIIFIGLIVYLTAQKTVEYNSLNTKWIEEANNAYRYDEKNFQDLLAFLQTQPPARIYAGRPGNWGKQFKLGSSELYMLLGTKGLDMTQFLPETWSMMSENDQNFDERITEDYDLLNTKTIVSDKNHDFAPDATLTKTFGPFNVYLVPTTGWFDVVSSPMFVKANKSNFLNLVYLWHRGFPRRWKMHPLITIDKNPAIPPNMVRTIEMVDEVSYIDITQQSSTNNSSLPITNNIFSDFPFTFPQATPSGQIRSENVDKQTYTATVEVPDTCAPYCTVMFKMSYHPNWRAKVDGVDVEKFAVFPYYLAVRTTPGTHTVEFTYQPNTLKVLLLVTTPFLLIGWIYIHKRFSAMAS